jgi:uncharacterized protein YgbK (DUF1537 family)
VNAFAAIADDLTGACDVAAELALAGRRVRVAVDAERVAPADGDDAIVVVNTQSRALDPRAAYARVRAALDARPARVVLKKIDTALRGHLGAELDAAVDLLAAPAFVLAAIPAAGRVRATVANGSAIACSPRPSSPAIPKGREPSRRFRT